MDQHTALIVFFLQGITEPEFLKNLIDLHGIPQLVYLNDYFYLLFYKNPVLRGPFYNSFQYIT